MADCRVCRTSLDPVLARVGVHLLCAGPATPALLPANEPVPHPAPVVRPAVGGERLADLPASTVDELGQLLAAHDADRPRSRQRGIGPSEVGIPCDRALLYRIYEIPECNERGIPWAPIQGTAIDAHVSSVLEWHNQQLGRERWLIHPRVSPGGGVEDATLDFFDRDTATLVDLKYSGISRIREFKKDGPPPEYRTQVQLYALGMERSHGIRPAWVRLAVAPRTVDWADSWEWTTRYDRAAAEAALERCDRLAELGGVLRILTTPALWASVPSTPSAGCVHCRHWRPGRPADDTGCPGDQAMFARRAAAASSVHDLIAP